MRALLASLLLAAAGAQAADLSPPGYPALVLAAQPTLRDPAVARLQLGRLPLRLEQTTLAELAQAGNAPITRERDKDGYQDWICLLATEGGRRVRIWAIAPDSGGGRITELHVQPGAAAPQKDCPAAPRELLPVKLPGGLGLGSTRAQLLQALGPPSLEQEGWLVYMSDRAVGPVPASGGTGIMELGILGLRLAQGRVEEFFVTQATGR